MTNNKLLTLILIILTIHLHQTTAQTTPTPAPTKTPTITPTISNTPTPNHQIPINKPLTQQDLNVLTGNVQRPNGLTWHNNKLYTACNGDWTLYEINDTTGDTTTFIYGIRNAHTLYIEGTESTNPSLWVPDFETNSLFKVTQNKAPETIASKLNGPWGITYLDKNSFLVSNLLNNSISIINRNGEHKEIVSDLRSPTGITTDKNYIYIANNGSSRRAIEWFEKKSITESDTITPQPLVSGLQNTTGLTTDKNGLLYFTYSLGTRGIVGRVDPQQCISNGGCSNNDVEIVIYTELAAPLAGLTISPDMRLFIHTIFRPEIYWVQLPAD